MTRKSAYTIRFYAMGWMREWYGNWTSYGRAKVAGEEIGGYIQATSFHVIDDRGRAVYSARIHPAYCSSAPNTYCPKHETVHISPIWAGIQARCLNK
jgi:hypothetical protein